MALAGIYQIHHPHNTDPLETFSILTTSPNQLMQKIHNRMPVIIEPENFNLWLDNSNYSGQLLKKLYQPLPENHLQAIKVSKYVNNVRNEGPQCLQPDSQHNLFDDL